MINHSNWQFPALSMGVSTISPSVAAGALLQEATLHNPKAGAMIWVSASEDCSAFNDFKAPWPSGADTWLYNTLHQVKTSGCLTLHCITWHVIICRLCHVCVCVRVCAHWFFSIFRAHVHMPGFRLAWCPMFRCPSKPKCLHVASSLHNVNKINAALITVQMGFLVHLGSLSFEAPCATQPAHCLRNEISNRLGLLEKSNMMSPRHFWHCNKPSAFLPHTFQRAHLRK